MDPKAHAMRRLYSLYPTHVAMLEKLANRLSGGNQSALLRTLIEERYEQSEDFIEELEAQEKTDQTMQ